MPLRIRFLRRTQRERNWFDKWGLMEMWKTEFFAPWLLVQHIAEICVLTTIFIEIITPIIHSTFLIRTMFQNTLCPDIDLHHPFSKLSTIQSFVSDTFLPNVESFINDSFSSVYLVDPDVPHMFTVTWSNGTVTEYPDLEMTIDLFRHVDNLRIATHLYYIQNRGKLVGCTEWYVATDVRKTSGSYTFSAAPVIKRDHCRPEFYAGKFDRTTLKQVHDLSALVVSLTMLSVVGCLNLVIGLVRRWRMHMKWRQSDSSYRDLGLYDQIHHSIGFWHPLHLLTEIILVVVSAILFVETKRMTQFVSIAGLRMFAVGVFMSFWMACRWFSFSPKTYELVLIIRVSFTRLLNIFVGLLPLICAFMMVGLFLFGLVSDISRSYYRFLQLFFGLIFGDDMYGVYSYYTDGTTVYTYMAFVYVTATGILAGYIFFPSFTATISFLRDHEVVPLEEGGEENQ